MKKKLAAICLAAVLALTMGLVPATPVSADPGPAIAGLWHFDGDANDSSGYNNHGSLVGDASFALGKFGQALSLDGVDDYVEVAHHTSLQPSEITIEAWIYPLSWDHTATAVALAVKRTAFGNGYFLFYYRSTSTITFDWGGSSGLNRWNTGYNPPLNTWTHLAVTRSSTGRALYVNGALYSSTTHAGAPANVPTTSALRVGYDSMAARYSFNGLIDEVCIWNEALDSGQIALSYSGSVGWLRPVTNADFTLQEGTTLPLKFQLYDNSGLVTDPQDVSLQIMHPDGTSMPVELGEGTGYLRWNEEEYHYIANLRAKDWGEGTYRATVFWNGVVINETITFELSPSKGSGRGNSGK